MPRKKKPAKIDVFWNNLGTEQLLNSDLTERLRSVAADPVIQAVVTVLINERPSAMGNADSSFILGYEHCLRKLQELLEAAPVENRTAIPEPNYSTPEIEKELAWTSKM